MWLRAFFHVLVARSENIEDTQKQFNSWEVQMAASVEGETVEGHH